MRLVHKIVLATLNLDKFQEFKELFAAYPDVELVPAGELIRNPGGLKFVETHQTYLENAAAKARLCNTASHYPALGDDSGLEVLVLDGKPGVRSHRYATPRAGVSQDQANIDLLLKEVSGKSPGKPIQARFVSTLAIVMEGIMLHTTGTLDGTIVDRPRGTLGFGYDSIFVPTDSDKTLAEMTAAEKNRISHRAKALHELMALVKNNGIVFAKP
jgi:XTP/dITP diphosphohydrolase